jgi:choline-glycine betaine transporter
MMLTLGVAAYGMARAMAGRPLRGLLVAGLGMLGAAQVRPHVAGLVALAVAAAYLIRPVARSAGGFPRVAKVIGLAGAVVIAVVLVNRTDQFLQTAAIQTEGGVTSVLEQALERTSKGGSQFAPSILESPARAPVAIATILFRPFPFEVDSPQTLAAAVEATFLLGLAAVRFRSGLAAIGSIRRQPYVAFALVYLGLFIFAFSSFANFGLLARERVQMLPLFLVFLAVPVKKLKKREVPDAVGQR